MTLLDLCLCLFIVHTMTLSFLYINHSFLAPTFRLYKRTNFELPVDYGWDTAAGSRDSVSVNEGPSTTFLQGREHRVVRDQVGNPVRQSMCSLSSFILLSMYHAFLDILFLLINVYMYIYIYWYIIVKKPNELHNIKGVWNRECTWQIFLGVIYVHLCHVKIWWVWVSFTWFVHVLHLI